MTDLQIFNNSEFGTIRTLEDNNGAVLFAATDVAQALGYTNPRKAVADHCRCVTKRDAPHPQAPDKTIEMSFIPESDLYRLVFSSKLPTAERFTDWVTSEVLPSIRKTGCYGTPDLSELSPELRCLIRLEQQQKQQAQELVRLNQKLDQLQGTGPLAPAAGAGRAPGSLPASHRPGVARSTARSSIRRHIPCWKSGSIAALPPGSKRSATSSASRAWARPGQAD